jgi:hypothetical protein
LSLQRREIRHPPQPCHRERIRVHRASPAARTCLAGRFVIVARPQV